MKSQQVRDRRMGLLTAAAIVLLSLGMLNWCPSAIAAPVLERSRPFLLAQSEEDISPEDIQALEEVLDPAAEVDESPIEGRGPVTVDLPNDGVVQDKAPLYLMPSEMRTILDRGELIVATRAVDTPPFVMYASDSRSCEGISVEQDGQTLCGLDIEIGKALADGLDVAVRFDHSASAFNEVVEKVFRGEADLALSKLSMSLTRAARLGMSDPYVNLRQGVLLNRVMLARATSDPDVSITDAVRTLEGPVGVLENTQYSRFANQLFPSSEVVEFPTWDEAIAALVRGELLAALRDEMEVKKVVLGDPRTALLLKTAIFTDTQDLIAAMVAWNKPQLRSYVNHYLQLNEPVSSADDLIERYPTVFTPAEDS
ncbi:MAG: transporter substrate-binding domain-containing protein [Cyanobacteria bacterium P01_A01_bin.3]